MSAGSSGGVPDGSVRQLPEIKACSASRAETRRELIVCRNLVPARLEQLDCPPRARESLSSWLDDLERELPDPGALAASMADADLHPEEFNARWAEVERIGRDAARMPTTAVDFLHAVAGHAAAGRLALLYWACLHYPLHDRYADLSSAVGKLLGCEWMRQQWMAQRIRQHAEASEESVEVYSYNSFDMYGDLFGWRLQVYRFENRIHAETRQWTSDQDAMAPALQTVDSGADLADLLRGGEVDGIWQIDRDEYQHAVERVFDFESELGIDFLDALVHEYDIELGPIERSELRAAWEKRIAQLDDESELRAEKAVEPATSAATSSGNPVSGTADSEPECEDPIAAALSAMKIEPVHISQPRQWAGQITAQRNAERHREACAFVVAFAQKNLELPRGRHIVRRDGRAGTGFWVDFE